MKSATRRKQHQNELREKILDAARELFVAEGVGNEPVKVDLDSPSRTRSS